MRVPGRSRAAACGGWDRRLCRSPEQENAAVTISVAEDAQQDPVSRLGGSQGSGVMAPLAQHGHLVFVEAELAEAATNLSAVRAAAYADAVHWDGEPERRAQCAPLGCREPLLHPAPGRLVAIRCLVELQGEPTRGHAPECGLPSYAAAHRLTMAARGGRWRRPKGDVAPVDSAGAAAPPALALLRGAACTVRSAKLIVGSLS